MSHAELLRWPSLRDISRIHHRPPLAASSRARETARRSAAHDLRISPAGGRGRGAPPGTVGVQDAALHARLRARIGSAPGPAGPRPVAGNAPARYRHLEARGGPVLGRAGAGRAGGDGAIRRIVLDDRTGGSPRGVGRIALPGGREAAAILK